MNLHALRLRLGLTGIQSYAGSLAQGAWLRHPLALRRSVGSAICFGVASGDTAEDREQAEEVLDFAIRCFEHADWASPLEMANAFDAAFDCAVAAIVGEQAAIRGFGLAAALMVPKWEVLAFSCRGNALFWRATRASGWRSIVPATRVGENRFEPLLTMAGGDRLLLAAGGLALTESFELGRMLNNWSGVRSFGSRLLASACERDSSVTTGIVAVEFPGSKTSATINRPSPFPTSGVLA